MLDFKNKPIFGMIHLAGERPIDRADQEIQILEEEGVDGIILENYHGSVKDIIKVLAWREEIDRNFKIGINILPNEYELAFAFADVYNLDFIQMDYVSGMYKRTNGNISLDTRNFIRFKEKYKHISVLGGVWPKYYYPVEGSVLAEDINEAKGLANGIVVTGTGTGHETPIVKIKDFKTLCGDIPLIIGAGLNVSNVKEQLEIADGAIVGSAFKPYNRTTEMISRELVKEFMDEVRKIR